LFSQEKDNRKTLQKYKYKSIEKDTTHGEDGKIISTLEGHQTTMLIAS